MSRDPNAYFNFALPTGEAPVVVLHPRQSRGAVASLILGLLALPGVLALIGFPMAIAGIVCGINGLIAIKKGGGRIRGKGLGIAGLILCVIALGGGGTYLALKKEPEPEPFRSRIPPLQHPERTKPLPPKSTLQPKPPTGAAAPERGE